MRCLLILFFCIIPLALSSQEQVTLLHNETLPGISMPCVAMALIPENATGMIDLYIDYNRDNNLEEDEKIESIAFTAQDVNEDPIFCFIVRTPPSVTEPTTFLAMVRVRIFLDSNLIREHILRFHIALEPFTRIDAILARVKGLISRRSPFGIATSVISKIDASLEALARENFKAAINQLGAAINELEAIKGKEMAKRRISTRLSNAAIQIFIFVQQAIENTILEAESLAKALQRFWSSNMPNSISGIFSQDLNNDGLRDLIITNTGSDTIHFGFTDREETFKFEGGIIIVPDLVHVLLIDVNFDGRKDLIGVSFGESSLFVYLNTGTGFDKEPSHTIKLATNPLHARAIDTNRDGRYDLIGIAQPLANQITFLGPFPNFATMFTYFLNERPLAIYPEPAGFLAPSFRGAIPLALITTDKNRIFRFEQIGLIPWVTEITHLFPIDLDRIPTSISRVQFGDFNRDDRTDALFRVIYTKQEDFLTSFKQVLLVYRNEGNKFTNIQTLELPTDSGHLIASDTNFDDRTDLVLIRTDPNLFKHTFDVLVGESDGTFQSPQNLSTSSGLANVLTQQTQDTIPGENWWLWGAGQVTDVESVKSPDLAPFHTELNKFLDILNRFADYLISKGGDNVDAGKFLKDIVEEVLHQKREGDVYIGHFVNREIDGWAEPFQTRLIILDSTLGGVNTASISVDPDWWAFWRLLAVTLHEGAHVDMWAGETGATDATITILRYILTDIRDPNGFFQKQMKWFPTQIILGHIMHAQKLEKDYQLEVNGIFAAIAEVKLWEKCKGKDVGYKELEEYYEEKFGVQITTSVKDYKCDKNKKEIIVIVTIEFDGVTKQLKVKYNAITKKVDISVI